MVEERKIKVYDTDSFKAEFMPSKELDSMLKDDFSKFFIVRVEEMYQFVKRPVPASRAITHTCIYLTEGEATMKIGSGSYKIHKDELLFVPAGQVFSFQEKDINKGYLCNFHDDILIGKFGNNNILKDVEFLRVWGNPMIKLEPEIAKFVQHIFVRILFDYSQNGLKNLDIIQSYLITLLCEVNQAYKPVPTSGQTTAVTITNKFKELIFASSKTKHRVTDYAALLNITPNHLNKTVKAITGKSPTKWIDEAILLEAKVLLSQSAMAISEIAVEVGIDDQAYFTRLFKKYEGITPSAFRKMIETS